MKEAATHTIVVMGTIVTIQASSSDSRQSSRQDSAIKRAMAWFHHIEERCTRFNPQSEAMRLTNQVGVSVPVSPVLYEAVGFALEVAKASDGAFDPTLGLAMESLGFNREYSTGQTVHTDIESCNAVSFRDVLLDPIRKAVTLLRPLVLDLGAVAKGLAVDMAVRELREFESFAINAGGDLYLGGCNPKGERWTIGIRHPRHEDALIDSVVVSNRAVCTSGDYERTDDDGRVHHILDPRTKAPAKTAASVTVIAQSTMLADALATAAFVLGPERGIPLLDRMGVDGLIVTPSLDRYETRGMSRDYRPGASPVL